MEGEKNRSGEDDSCVELMVMDALMDYGCWTGRYVGARGRNGLFFIFFAF